MGVDGFALASMIELWTESVSVQNKGRGGRDAKDLVDQILKLELSRATAKYKR